MWGTTLAAAGVQSPPVQTAAPSTRSAQQNTGILEFRGGCCGKVGFFGDVGVVCLLRSCLVSRL